MRKYALVWIFNNITRYDDQCHAIYIIVTSYQELEEEMQYVTVQVIYMKNVQNVNIFEIVNVLL